MGHDWGGLVAWKVAKEYPELINKLVILNAPHLSAMSKHVRKHPSQLLKSSYILFFQLRGIPEKMVSRSDWQLATEAIQNTSNEGTFSKNDLKEYRLAWSKPNAMQSMINWYRANLKFFASAKVTDQITVPTYVIWVMKDQFLSWKLAEKSLEFCDQGQGTILGESTHWLHHEKPEQISVQLAHEVSELIMVDSSNDMLKVVDEKIKQSKLENTRTLLADFIQEVPEIKADIVMISLVLLYIPNTRAILENVYPVLNKGGKLIIVDFDYNEKVKHPKVHSGFKRDELKRLLSEIGFQSSEIRNFHHAKDVFMNQDADVFIAISQKN